MSFIEKFQENNNSGNNIGNDLNTAYTNTINNINESIYNNSNNFSYTVDSDVSGNSVGVRGTDDFNLWSLLGFDTLREEQRECLFDCAIDSTKCLENATSRNCEYKCYREILNCSKGCYELPESKQSPQSTQFTQSTQSPQSTQSKQLTNSNDSINSLKSNISNTTQSIQSIPVSKNEIRGIYTNSDYFAPYNADLWPSQSKSGWDDEKLDNYFNDLQNRDDTIEVRVNTSLFPINTDKPDLLF